MTSSAGAGAGSSRAAWPRGVAAAALGLFVVAMLTAPLAPLFDPDEGYYPATAAESVDAGRFWDPRFNGEPRWDKPILTYALIEGSFALLGRSVTAARLPTAVEGALLVLLAGGVAARLAGRRSGVWTAWVLASTLGVGVFARAAHPELAVVLGVTAAELCLVLYLLDEWRERRSLLALAAGLAVGFGTLAKGPVAVALPVITLVCCIPILRQRRPPAAAGLAHLALAGLVAAVVALPWYAAMTLRYGEPFLAEAIWHHNVARYASRSFGHTAGLFYFVLPLCAMLVPWTAFLPAALAAAFRPPRDARGLLLRVMTIAGLVAFVFYSLSASKLPHYALAFVPPFAIAIGLHLAGERAGSTATSRAMVITAALLAVVGLVLAAAPWLVGTVIRARDVMGGSPTTGEVLRRLILTAAWPPAALLLAGAAALAVWRTKPARQVGTLGVIGVALPLTLIVSATPLLRVTYQWDRLGRLIPHDGHPILMVGPRSPSLTFFAGRPIQRVTEEELEAALASDPAAWIVVDTAWLHRDAASRLAGRRIDVVDDRGTMSLAYIGPGTDGAGGTRTGR